MHLWHFRNQAPDQSYRSGKPDYENLLEGFRQCYNVQAAVDGKSQLIVAADGGQSNDHSQASKLLDQLPRVSDTGYRSEAELRVLETRGVDAYVVLGREGKQVEKAKHAEDMVTEHMLEKLESDAGRACSRSANGRPRLFPAGLRKAWDFGGSALVA